MLVLQVDVGLFRDECDSISGRNPNMVQGEGEETVLVNTAAIERDGGKLILQKL